MKIAYISDVIYPFTKGGSEKRIHEFSIRLSKRGHEVHIFCPRWWNTGKMFKKDDVVFHGISSLFMNKNMQTRNRKSIVAALDFSLNLFRSLAKERFDIIDCNQSPILHIYPAKLYSLKKAHLIISWFEVWENYWSEYMGILGAFGRLIEQNVLQSSHPDRFVTISEYTKGRLISLGVADDNIQIIPNGVNYDEIQRVTPSEEELDVIFAGRLIKAKGVDILIRAISFLKEKFPNVKAGIVGDGPERIYAEKMVRLLDIEKNTRFFGFIEDFRDVIALMKSSKVFVYPSAAEGGASLSMIEANACGLPTISISHGDLGTSAEAIKDGFNGLLVNQLSPKLMAEKIGLVLENEELRKKMANNSLIFAKQYDWEKMTDLLENLYNDVDN